MRRFPVGKKENFLFRSLPETGCRFADGIIYGVESVVLDFFNRCDS